MLRSTRFLLPLFILTTLFGCSDSPAPDTPGGDGASLIDGTIDPGQGTFILKTLTSPVPDGVPVSVQLVGSDLQADAGTGQVSLVVAVRNADSRQLFAPADIVVGDFLPATVGAANADWIQCARDTFTADWPPGACRYGFDYTALFGEDGVLDPGEISEGKRWIFNAPGLVSFSFAAWSRFGMEPDRPRIGGIYFFDPNENGIYDPGEAGIGSGAIEVLPPGQDVTFFVSPGPDGRYAVPIETAGLYRLTAWEPPIASPLPVRFTTPNPLQVIISPGPDGRPTSFLAADFGVAVGPPPPDAPPVLLVEELPDSVSQDFYSLLRMGLFGDRLGLLVGYSGCGPEHPLQLYMVGSFMESQPPQARLVLSHDDLGEMCDAFWEQPLQYDLWPIRRAYEQAYGPGGGTLILNLVTPSGAIEKVVWRF